MAPSADEEAAFMADLLSGLDNSFFDAAPTPDPSPQKKIALPTSGNKRIPLSPLSNRKFDNPSLSVLQSNEPPLSDVFSNSSNLVTQVPLQNVDMDALLDGVEDWDWNDMDADFMSPNKAKTKAVRRTNIVQVHGRTRYRDDRSTRLSRKGMIGTWYTNCAHSSTQNCTVVTQDRERMSVILRDDWVRSEVRVGDIVNIIGTFEKQPDSTSSIIISRKRNLLILHPDLLLTATAISNAPQCTRRPLISSLLRSTSDTTPALVWGNMLHEVMQRCLSTQRWDDSSIDSYIDEMVRKGIAELVKIGFNVQTARTEVKARAVGLKKFSERFISNHPKADAVLTDTRSSQNTTSLLAITILHDVEEDIWSPKYGIKGKIDASVQVSIEERSPLTKSIASWTMPFEIKTGRSMAGMEHRAQTMLYTLLMADRYGVDVPSGLLFYTQSDEVIKVAAGWNEVRGLIMARNDMALHTMQRMRVLDSSSKKIDPGKSVADAGDIEDSPQSGLFLPPTIDDERVCTRCWAVDACMLFRKAVENVVDHDSPIANLYEVKTSHLSAPQMAFFKKWEALIALEEQDLVRFRKELWTMGAKDREEKGRCLGSMALDPSYRPPVLKGEVMKDQKIHRFTYRFIRQNGHRDLKDASKSLLNGQILDGDPITVSVEPHLLAYARGFVLELTATQIVVGVDHEITKESILLRSPGFKSSARVVFRIDKDELAGGMGRVRDNIAQLFYAGGDTRRLELVVDLKPPAFDESEVSKAMTLATSLNVNQQQAMAKAMGANDYALILGMPGTGKTTTIAEIIRELVRQGKTVLLTSYTHSAVDTILLKLKDTSDFDILRIGNLDKIHPDIHQFTLSARPLPTTVEQLEHQILSPPIVATTCLSIDHRAARKGGLDVSLFRRLSDAHPHAVVDLAYQYRMNEDIMVLSNKLIYGDRLKCGSKAVANQTLKLPDANRIPAMHKICGTQECWLEQLMQESRKAVFVDTDSVPAKDSRIGDLVQNEVEASLVTQVVDNLLEGGIREDQVGIISLYRQQVKLLSHLLQDKKQIEILTADRSQGRDKDCIIISLVRANDDGNIGDLLKDWRRMNVAFTRARSKLIIFGSRKTLQVSPLLAEFFSLMDERGWILQLPPGADTLHTKPPTTRITNKRPATEDLRSQIKENDGLRKKVKKVNAEEGMLRSRPVLRDVFNASKGK
ncbi:Dna2-domain-containing protein [Rickenella mellea]|uniref:DNA replication ATP-dependent helicase/nuclease n=1 Tax=Rickenella mellea TaxID=50990 RepID=A0A4Y7PYN9_9AGAM|nr:Dna2-domain-containing protein [Rickenella mellea]